jgi:membrane peptidoglycan carboxypeptidase
VSPHEVLKVTTPGGQVLESFDPNAGRVQVMTAQLAYLMTDLLRGPVKLYLGSLGARPVAGKSGTTEAFTGSIYIGYTPNLAVAASLMHIDAGAQCKSGYAYLASTFAPSGWQCPTAVLYGEDVGVAVWKPFLEAYYSRQAWPKTWGEPPGIVTRQVCKYDGGYVSGTGIADTFNEIFLQGVGEPSYACGSKPYPGEPAYVQPSPVPSPSPSPSPSPH